MDALPIIDAHQHFWDLSMGRHPWLMPGHKMAFRYGDYSALRRTYLPDDYFRDAAGFNVVRTVHMEAEWDPADPLGETAWLMALREATGWPSAIVGQAWFARDDIATVLAGQAACPLMRSIRQKPAAAPSPGAARPRAPGSLADPAFRTGFAMLGQYGLHYDLQTPWWHLDEAAELARDYPGTTIILNHTGLPADRSARGLAAWRQAMEHFAACPNAMVKISGICVPGERWTADLNRDVVLETVRIFGPDRAMFASNFPVDSLLAGFGEIFGGFLEITKGLSEAHRRKLFHDTAERVYRPV